MRNNKLFFIIVGVILIVLVGYLLNVGLFKKSTVQEPTNTKLQVSSSFYPLYYFASEIGKDKTHVINITPAGVEPHDYDPTPQDIARIQESNVLIYNGAGFEPWLDKIKGDFNKTTLVDTSAEVQLEESKEESGKDPHIWLSPILAKSQVNKIVEGFITVDTKNKSLYEKNGDDLKQKIDELDKKYKEGLRSCKQKSFVTSHAAFGYLAREYNLTQVPISGLSPDEEPSPAELVKVTKFAKENNVKYIFFETLVSPKLAETIAKEISAQTLVLDPVEGLSDDDIAQGKNYFTVMESNLKNLQIALECNK